MRFDSEVCQALADHPEVRLIGCSEQIQEVARRYLLADRYAVLAFTPPGGGR